MQAKLTKIELEKSDMAKANSNLSLENRGLEEELSEYTKYIGQLKDQLAVMQGKNAELENTNEDLEEQKHGMEAKIKQLADDLGGMKNKLSSIDSNNKNLSDDNNILNQEKGKLAGELDKLGKEMGGLQDEMGGLKDTIAKLVGENKKLGNQNENIGQAKKNLESELADLDKKVNKLNNEIDKLDKQNKEKDEKVQTLAQNNKDLEQKVKDLGDREKARNKLCDELEKAFKKNNVPAEVDAEKGEIVIPFEESYFDYDSDKLKVAMKEKLDRAIPIFSQTIFKQKEGSRVKSMEMIGYASPIYKGERMEVGKIDKFNREGMEYNMDLSYRRARSIFKYIFNPDELQFNHQGKMLKMTYLSSNSYIVSDLKPLPNKDSIKVPNYLSKGRQYCKKYNCADWHKVTIRFNIE